VPLYERCGERSAMRNTREANAMAPTGCRGLFCHVWAVLLSCEAIRGSWRLNRSLVASGFELPFCNADGRWQVRTTPTRRQHATTQSSIRSQRCDLAARAKEDLQVVLVPISPCAYAPTPLISGHRLHWTGAADRRPDERAIGTKGLQKWEAESTNGSGER
jgi:hypothetical protein